MSINKTVLLAGAIIISLTGFAQQNSIINKWVAGDIGSLNSNPAAEDMAKQIKILEITKKTDENSYTGTVKYGSTLPRVPHPCSLIITGQNFTIEANGQKWMGKKLKIKNDKMTCTLGSLEYHFKKELAPVRRPQGPQATFTLLQVQGSWQETGRTNSNKNPISIGAKDSFYIRIISKDSAMYLWGGAGNVITRGKAEIIKGNNLNIAGDFSRKIVSLTDELMVLEDYNDNTVHSFRKTTLPYPGERKKHFMPTAEVDLSPTSLIKKWFVYSIDFYSKQAGEANNVISSVNILEKNSEEKYSGNIEFGNKTLKDTQTLPCTFIFNGNELRIEAKSYTWIGQINKANGDTMIYRQNEIMYYFKKIKPINPPAMGMGTDTIDLRPGSLIGDWFFYKSDFEPGFKPKNGTILRGLNIINSLGNMKYNGKVTFDSSRSMLIQDCTIQFSVDTINKRSWALIETKGYSWYIEIIIADGKDIVMGKKSDGIIYYFRK